MAKMFKSNSAAGHARRRRELRRMPIRAAGSGRHEYDARWPVAAFRKQMQNDGNQDRGWPLLFRSTVRARPALRSAAVGRAWNGVPAVLLVAILHLVVTKSF